jgi:RimJ/RimL family protein N-acetyltransferase
MITVIVTFTPAAGKQAALAAWLLANQARVRRCAGFRSIALHKDERGLVEIETWDSADAHRAMIDAIDFSPLDALVQSEPDVRYLDAIPAPTPPRFVPVGKLSLAHTTLRDEALTLEPLAEAHLAELTALFDVELWRWYSARIDSPAALERFMRARLDEQARGGAMGYVARVGEAVAGATSFLHIAPDDRRVEIGSTWWAKRWQRTFVNSTAKRLMLTHAFETMGALAVELRTDALNAASRRAIERIGATYCGVLPAHRICDDGRVRDTAIYAITDLDWPAVRERVSLSDRRRGA